MPTTSNFGWTTPADTDLVKDGAAAIRTLGNGIDSSLVDLKGGTTGQILSKASNTDLDYTWIANDQGDITQVQAGVGISVASGTGPIPVITNSSTDLITTAGDILYGTAADTVARLGIGTAGQVLKVNSGATAPEWGAAGGAAGITLVSSTSLSAATTNINSVFSSTYENYVLVLNVTSMTSGANIRYRLRASGTDTTTNYLQQYLQNYTTTLASGEGASTDFWQFGAADPGQCFIVTELARPFASDKTWAIAHSITGFSGVYTDLIAEYQSAIQNSSTSFDGITVYSHNGATITGTLRIYGRANS